MTHDGFAELGDAQWGAVRIVYLQHPSDPMTFISIGLAYVWPDWLGENRGPEVSPCLRWFPIVTFFLVGFDIPMATNVPLGHGHKIAPGNYINAWVEVTQSERWTEAHTQRLKPHFKGFDPSPLYARGSKPRRPCSTPRPVQRADFPPARCAGNALRA